MITHRISITFYEVPDIIYYSFSIEEKLNSLINRLKYNEDKISGYVFDNITIKHINNSKNNISKDIIISVDVLGYIHFDAAFARILHECQSVLNYYFDIGDYL